MRILLVQPRPQRGTGLRYLSSLEPLALETVAACLLKEHEVKILDFPTPRKLASMLASYKPKLCGISCDFTMDVYNCLNVAKQIRKLHPRIKIMVGGHHPTLNPQDFHKDFVDYIVIGEGEETALELASCLEGGGDPREIPGLVLNTLEGQAETRRRPLISDLDALPLPARRLTENYRKDYYLTLWRPISTVETARGCPYRCSYCSVWKFYQGKCRTRSPERVVEALTQVKSERVMFTDDNFLLDVPRARRIAALIKETGLKKTFFFQARSDAIVQHPEVIRELRQAGLENIFIGFEAIEDDMLKSLNKKNAVENNEAALEVANSLGVCVTASFIVDPQSNRQEFEKLRRYVRRLRASFRLLTPSFSVLTPLPGTDLARSVMERATTTHYDLFDLFHSVLPTNLPLPDFYKEFASCYAEGVSPGQVFTIDLRRTLYSLVGLKLSPRHLWRTINAVRTLRDFHSYLRDHEYSGKEFAPG